MIDKKNITKQNITKQNIIKYLSEVYKIDVDDTRTLFEIVIEKFKKKLLRLMAYGSSKK